MKPLDHLTYDLPFSKLRQVEDREGLKLPQDVIDQLVGGTGLDIKHMI